MAKKKRFLSMMLRAYLRVRTKLEKKKNQEDCCSPWFYHTKAPTFGGTTHRYLIKLNKN